MRFVNLGVDRDELVTINTALMVYLRYIKDYDNIEDIKKARMQIGKVDTKVQKAFGKFEKVYG